MDRSIKILVIVVLVMTAIILGWFIFNFVISPYLVSQSFETHKTGEALQIQNVADDGTGKIVVYVQNVGDAPLTLVKGGCVYVNGELSADGLSADRQLAVAETASLHTGKVAAGTVTVKVVSRNGTFSQVTRDFG